MADVLFGYFPIPIADNYEETVRLVVLAEELGVDLIGIQDHPYQRRFLDTFALIADLAARTSRIRFFPDVADLPLRPPAMMAKAAASIDRMSEGRFELGLGAGNFWDVIEAMGGPRRTPGEAFEATEEAIAVLRLMWSGGRGLRFDGKHYRLHGVHSGPTPAHPIEIWVGAYGPRILSLIGRAGDGWIPSAAYAPPEKLGKRNARIDEAALAAGRDPKGIRRIYNVWGPITDGATEGPFHGPGSQWVDTLTHLAVDLGMDAFIFGAAEGTDEEQQLRRFAEEIAPAVRANARR
jgi:alkanesulfonate monooxygenase SsuD/methylene tetrahydromethanopterin reductase-like flavin-dependent oxidoreductase (luciferase family)